MRRSGIQRKTRLKDTPLRPSTKRPERTSELRRLRAPGTPARPDRGIPKGTRRGWNSTLRPVSPKSGGHRFPKFVDEAFRAAVRELPCVVTGLRTGAWLKHPKHGWLRIHVDPAHVKSRGSGGKDHENIVPLARHLHDELDGSMGPKTFARTYRVDLPAEARRVWAEYLAAHPEMAA